MQTGNSLIPTRLYQRVRGDPKQKKDMDHIHPSRRRAINESMNTVVPFQSQSHCHELDDEYDPSCHLCTTMDSSSPLSPPTLQPPAFSTSSSSTVPSATAHEPCALSIAVAHGSLYRRKVCVQCNQVTSSSSSSSRRRHCQFNVHLRKLPVTCTKRDVLAIANQPGMTIVNVDVKLDRHGVCAGSATIVYDGTRVCDAHRLALKCDVFESICQEWRNCGACLK